MASINYKKAFGSVFQQAISNELLNQGVDTAYINLLQSMGEKATVTVCLNDLEVEIDKERGV